MRSTTSAKLEESVDFATFAMIFSFPAFHRDWVYLMFDLLSNWHVSGQVTLAEPFETTL
jgi:hypothetical protein